MVRQVQAPGACSRHVVVRRSSKNITTALTKQLLPPGSETLAMASKVPLAPSHLELVHVGGEAHGWVRQPYGRFDLSWRP